MPDMLVKLYDLPETVPGVDLLEAEGILIKRPLPHNKHLVIDYIRETFGRGWASECEACFANQPVSCFIALKGREVVGFASYEATAPDFFGPTGVSEAYRGHGIGRVLLLKCLLAMRELGYGYAIIGGVDDAKEFYRKSVNATVIEGSYPGVYQRSIGIEETLNKKAQSL
jgi:GNAT superfamily N-acetyltransferase